MSSIKLSPELEEMRAVMRKFAMRELEPLAAIIDATGAVPDEVTTVLAKNGYLGMRVDEQYGGGGVDDYKFGAVMQEEVSDTGVIGSANGMTLHNDIVLPYYLSLANDDQKARWLPKMVTGEYITAIAITEPNAGSDMAGTKTTAVKKGDTYVVNGSKTFITNGPYADTIVFICKLDEGNEPRERKILHFVLDRGMPGDGVIDLRGIRRMVEATGYDGLIDVEIFSANNWWKRDPNEVLRICLERHQTVV